MVMQPNPKYHPGSAVRTTRIEKWLLIQDSQLIVSESLEDIQLSSISTMSVRTARSCSKNFIPYTSSFVLVRVERLPETRERPP